MQPLVALRQLDARRASWPFMRSENEPSLYSVVNYTRTLFLFSDNFLHLCTFKTPTSSAVMSEQGDADCAFIMRNGVRYFTKNYIYSLFSSSKSSKFIIHLPLFNDFICVNSSSELG